MHDGTVSFYVLLAKNGACYIGCLCMSGYVCDVHIRHVWTHLNICMCLLSRICVYMSVYAVCAASFRKDPYNFFKMPVSCEVNTTNERCYLF